MVNGYNPILLNLTLPLKLSIMPSLLHKLGNTGSESALVRRSVNCFENGMNGKRNHLLSPSISNQMTVNLNVLSLLMKHRILGNIDCRVIITVQRHRSILSKTKLQH